MKPSTLNPQQQKQIEVITRAGCDPSQFVGVEHAWWMNPTNHNSLRLTALGYKWFTQHGKVRFHVIKLPEDRRIFPKQLLQLERLFTEPYFIRGYKEIHVSGEKDAVMLQLHAGDLVSYLNNLEDNR